MDLKALHALPKGGLTKTLRIMKLTAIIILSACLTASATGYSQKVTLSEKNARLEKVFKEIKKQTGYVFFYDASILDGTKPVSIDVKNASVEQVLQESLKNQLLDFSIQNKTITIIRKDIQNINDEYPLPPPPITIKGRVVNESGEGVVVSVLVKGTSNGTTSNAGGYFELNNVDENATLVITGVSIDALEVKVNARTEININAKTKIVEGEDVRLSTGYWTTTKRNATGSIVKVDGKEIERQPVTSPLMALQGRVAGLDIAPSTGAPGGQVTVQIRGRNSVRFEGNYPLYVIDGIPIDSRPIESNNSSVLQGAGYDPINTINPANIESIEVLKDADATAIYGSRGANGVILITTKRGSGSDKTNIQISSYFGFGKVSKFVDLLDTKQYLEMRREAFQNAGATPQTWDGFDLLQWDTTRYTNWQREIFGQSAGIFDLQLNVSGGNKNTNFRFGGSHHKEGMVFPGDFGFTRTTGNFSLNHVSNNNRFRSLISANYAVGTNKIFSATVSSDPVTAALLLPPIAPKIYNNDGTLNWENSTWTNPYSSFLQTDNSRSNNLLVNGSLNYELIPGLLLKTNLGYSYLDQSGVNKFPFTSMDPAFIFQGTTAQSYFEASNRNSWIIEPQVSYSKKFSNQSLDIVVGTSWQQAKSSRQLVNAIGYTSDVQLASLRGATTTIFLADGSSDYRYTALFGRIGYNFKEKYIVNLTGRRDGSSRYGPNNRFATFGAVGVAWIFTNENFFERNLSFLSFGKLRASYGSSGNDQIGDYKYLSVYNYSNNSYQGTIGVYPGGLYNPDYAWELTRKLEATIELGFLKDRVLLTASWYRNRSSNQVLDYPLPSITGFPSVLTNLNALVQNTGFELNLQTIGIAKNEFQWTTSFNVSIPRNKLIEFEGLEKSSYNTTFEVGKSLNLNKVYNSKGVNPLTGYYEVEDVNSDGVIDNSDRIFSVDVGRKYFGGLFNTFRFKEFELSFLLQFSKQIKGIQIPLAGQPTNIPSDALDRWRKPNDMATYQRFSTDFDIFDPFNQYSRSNGSFSDASFLRLKTLTFSYQLPSKLLERLKFSSLRFFIQGQNLFTLTKFKTTLDPETGNFLPPLTMLTGGIDIKF